MGGVKQIADSNYSGDVSKEMGRLGGRGKEGALEKKKRESREDP